MTITFSSSVKRENIGRLKRLLKDRLLLFPSWLQSIEIQETVQKKENKRANLQTLAEIHLTEYRQAIIKLFPGYFNKPLEQSETITHELAHLPTLELLTFTENLIADYVKDDQTKRNLKRQLNRISEQSTQDLTEIYERLLETRKRNKTSVK